MEPQPLPPVDSAHQADASFRKWLLAGLIVSLLIHAVLFIFFRLSKLERFEMSAETPHRLVPRPFSVKQAQIDPKAFEPEAPPSATERPKALPKLPEPALERPNVEQAGNEVRLSHEGDKMLDPILNEKPSVTEAKVDPAIRPGPNAAIEQELNATRQALVNDVAPKVAANSKLKLPTGIPSPGTEGDTGTGTLPGFSNLDDLLTQSGPLTGDVPPLNMPGGALFEYDSAELLPASIQTLEKLGELIRRNPRATFSIEGHTDSFGSDEYNISLSIARANAVKQWLVNHMGIPAESIDTVGFGSQRLLAPPTGTPEEQQINRRVEIVIRTPR